ncbi:formimidoylglutamase [Fulvivirgaceae bacterium PWU4]|uniref:Formimidoylglutamase n=1 Tax=Chryseosolibacter histidini TaxID=2782349 RepID=A0AAP2GHV8_9BACT|nr:formimidoylglutamase [Chryseosolibacter histidini]MBT1696474.1 formimidoylglutamase [Chryseosolibacter histidini]
MDLTILFSPVDETVYRDITSSTSFFKNISVFGEKMPDYKDAHIALIGIKEERGTRSNAGTAQGADEIRKKLYNLKRGTGAYRIVDLGNLNLGHDLEETYVRISEVCRMLLERNVLPVLIGGTHDLDYGQYCAYETMEKLVSILNVDAMLDLEDKNESGASRQHIHKILLHEPNYLFSYTHLAYQSYLIDPLSISILEKLYFEAFRLGQIRTNIQEVEPAIRNADLLSFDVTAIRSADAPGNASAQPFGLSGEEACQICWYAGLNEKLSSIGFYEYNPQHDDAHKKTAAVIATMIWYFIEGYYCRKNESNFRSNDFLKYTVSMPVEPEVIQFYKSKFSEKWWMEVPYPNGRERYARNSIVPCSYNDYQTAIKGEVPERYISTLAKLI